MTYKQYKIKEISIHALREESDSKTFGGRTIVCISIHALREESDFVIYVKTLLLDIFQSTLSVRRATILNFAEMLTIAISIHALREESDREAERQQKHNIIISIHALREESDW